MIRRFQNFPFVTPTMRGAQRRNLLFADSLTRLFGKTDSWRKKRASE